MQIYALDFNEELISARKAEKQRNYICLECRSPVRLRSGQQRQPHFYHAQPNMRCTLHAKSMVHLMLQYYLHSILPESELECRFPSIQRIADVAWHSQKIVFEIQCSPMTAEELLKRTFSYQSLDYCVVWIFHDQRYNQEKLSSVEDAAQPYPHYFSNMDSRGNGVIYDQFSFVQGRSRVLKLPSLKIDLSSVRCASVPEEALAAFPLPLFKRFESWPIYFAGDILDRLHAPRKDQLQSSLQSTLEAMESIQQNEKEQALLSLLSKKADGLLQTYRILFNFLLEKACL